MKLISKIPMYGTEWTALGDGEQYLSNPVITPYWGLV
jgi:hypothetical protein